MLKTFQQHPDCCVLMSIVFIDSLCYGRAQNPSRLRQASTTTQSHNFDKANTHSAMAVMKTVEENKKGANLPSMMTMLCRIGATRLSFTRSHSMVLSAQYTACELKHSVLKQKQSHANTVQSAGTAPHPCPSLADRYPTSSSTSKGRMPCLIQNMRVTLTTAITSLLHAHVRIKHTNITI